MADSKLAMWFIGAEIYALRSLLKVSQVELGRRLGYGYQSIANWEQGKRVPKIAIVRGLCAMAKVEPSRSEFLLFVVERHREPDIVANLEWRRISIIEQAERAYGEIFKYEPLLIPGPLQVEGYRMEVLVGDNPILSWRQKSRRALALEHRKDLPQVQMAFGYGALRYLRRMTDWKSQIENLIEASRRPNWEVLVVDDHHRGVRAGFDPTQVAWRLGALALTSKSGTPSSVTVPPCSTSPPRTSLPCLKRPHPAREVDSGLPVLRVF